MATPAEIKSTAASLREIAGMFAIYTGSDGSAQLPSWVVIDTMVKLEQAADLLDRAARTRSTKGAAAKAIESD